MFLQKDKEMKDIVKEWGMQDDELFASSQLLRPYKKGKPLDKKIDKKEIYEMQYKFKGDLKKMLGDTTKFPNELIFIGRNMNLVRSINKRCGSQVNRINIMANQAVKGMRIKNYTYQQYFYLFIFRLRLFGSSAIYSLLSFYYKIFKGQGLEDILDKNIKEMT